MKKISRSGLFKNGLFKNGLFRKRLIKEKLKEKINKKNLFKRFGFDVLFFGVAFGIVSYAVKLLSKYITEIQSYSSKIMAVNEEELVSMFGNISALSDKIYYAMYFIIPVLVYLIYCLLQGISFFDFKQGEKNEKGEKHVWKKHIWKYVGWFSAVSLIPFIAFMFLIHSFFTNNWLLILFFVFSYVAFLLYIVPNFKGLENRIWDYKNFLWYLIYILLWILILLCLIFLHVSMKLSSIWVLFFVVCLGVVFLLSLLKEKMIIRGRRELRKGSN